jgi:hypothetical protein
MRTLPRCVVATAAATSAKPSATTPVAKPVGACPVAAGSAPVPVLEPFATVPTADKMSVKLDGLAPNSTVVAGARPVEFSVTVCNSSPVNYPQVSLVVALSRCTCSDNPITMAEGTMERFDEASNMWQTLPHPAMGGGMDYLITGYGLGAFPKGRTVTVRFRAALDATMKAGTGGITVAAAGEPGPYKIAQIEVPLTVRAA